MCTHSVLITTLTGGAPLQQEVVSKQLLHQAGGCCPAARWGHGGQQVDGRKVDDGADLQGSAERRVGGVRGLKREKEGFVRKAESEAGLRGAGAGRKWQGKGRRIGPPSMHSPRSCQ